MARTRSLAELPLYADDTAIGAAVLGSERASEWKAMAPLLEARGLPKIDALHGARFVPDVCRFYGVERPDSIRTFTPAAPAAHRGVEKPEGLWNRSQKRRA